MMRVWFVILALFLLNVDLVYYTYRHTIQEQQKCISEIQTSIKELKQQIQSVKSQIKEQNKKLNQIELQQKQLETRFNIILKKTKKFIRSTNPSLSENEVDLYAKVFIRCSLQYRIPLHILLAVAYQESHFKPYAQNGRCYGMMQVNLDVWSKKFSLPEWLLKDPVRNIEAGAYILRYYYDKTGSWKQALIRYYGLSPFAVKIYAPSVIRKSQKLKQYVADVNA